MTHPPFRSLRARLGALYGQSIYGSLLLVVLGGLVVPALVGGYLIVGLREQQAAHTALNETLQRNADILALGMQESLWNMNADAARSLAQAVMRDRSIVRVQVTGQAEAQFIDLKSPAPRRGNVVEAQRDVVVRGERIGHVLVAMDDARTRQDLREKRRAYIFVLAGQLSVSLLLIVLLLNKRVIRPLRRLMRFSERLSQGDFETGLDLRASRDELGRLARQLEQTRVAIRRLFDDVRQREERFRTIVTQVPGAVFRYRPDGPIEFVSDAIEDISGYTAAQLMRGTTHSWVNLITPEDRRMQRRTVRDAIAEGRAYETEYRIVDATGTERWVLEIGQPQVPPEGGEPWVDGILSDISERKDNEMRIEALLAEQGAILDNVMFGVMFVRHRTIMSVNRRCEELFGYEPGEMVGKSTAIVFPTSFDFEAAGVRQYPTLGQGEYFSEERHYRRRDGTLFWCMVSGCAIDQNRPYEGSIWVYADITARKEAEEKLRLSATVLEHIADGVLVVDTQRRIVAVNTAFTQITGYAEDEALGRDIWLMRSGRHDDAFHDTLWQELVDTGHWQGELWCLRKNGEQFVEALTITAVRDTHGTTTHYVGVFRDITLVKENERKLDHLAHHDPLTALPNRLLFNDRLQHAIDRAQRSQEQLALLFIDLDRFKNVNDTLGHHIGDELLKQVADALAARLRDGDTLARLGGDEFVVLLEGVAGEYAVTLVAEKLVTMFEQPFTVAGHELFVTCSVGISLYPSDATDLNMLIRNADVAMYQAKARGRNGYRFYAPSMTGEGVQRLRLEAYLRRSLEKDEMFLNYQPQVEIDTGRLIGVEALVRWNHPELGLVPPGRFVPLAEDTGFISQLGQWVLREACRQMVRWQEAGLVVPKIAVNLSVRQFERGTIVATVADILRETGLEPHRLQLEVTESLIMNTGDALAHINGLHALGVSLAIDDFGTGYSSLAYLKQMPVQTLKIDRSFIQDIHEDVNDEAIAIAIIQLGKSMNLAVIAEGVETDEQATFLLRHGCNQAQGYFYSRPVMPDDLQRRWLP
ncbi:PAS domain S-box-containing protein/diguanylate cyclase (GGDEF)-like protein [Pseudoduganella flava]|uniref:EAL domain-containing protein n=1 Tax=Pseudoduganella flava TaxID=871742 RepID=A0A562PKM8_9BURK|nr:EAL domain-containing protein [Pseudoduganella flava]QGZ42234.1 EAL domain-containing protein [Pseudoduganella flava]TWI44770.1 PAS domain S-box-containing protein/diguanylate cyclase (GGDEF)-like protein [Pseudoduganella flava]